VRLLGDWPIVRAGVRLLLQGEPGFTVVDDQDIGTTAAADVIILDIDGESALQLSELSPTVLGDSRLLILASALDRTTLARAFRHGATGVVMKQERPEVLFESVRKVFAGEVRLDPSATAHLLDDLARQADAASAGVRERERSPLTARERQVVSLVSTGLRNTDVAAHLNISEVTVRNHLTAIFRKLGLSSRLQLALYGLSNGLGKLPMKSASMRVSAPCGAKPVKTQA
jgi:DNA-binding NarL/FixJ family response regulator